MVESSIMNEARKRGNEYIFKGTVGRLDDEVTPTAFQDTGRAFHWIYEPVNVSVGTSGEFQVSSETQLKLSRILSESDTAAKTITKDESGSPEETTTDNGDSRDDGLENTGSDNLPTPENEVTSTMPANSEIRHVIDCPGSQATAAQPSLEFEASEKLLLVPFANPVKCGRNYWKSDDYQIHEAIPSYTTGRPWIVFTNHKQNSDPLTKVSTFIMPIAFMLVTSVPVIINGVLTKFDKGHSTYAQRVWTMTWLGFGLLGVCSQVASLKTGRLIRWAGLLLPRTDAAMSAHKHEIDYTPTLVGFLFDCFLIIYSAPAIGGFVVVGQMLRSYGICVTVS
ncbi:Nacht domain protein [Rutstroemia sp. NJR-2017a WRK4]|nr:Nacht domain protein [Rutstroemia sp. NJR-2017a WRK4]